MSETPPEILAVKRLARKTVEAVVYGLVVTLLVAGSSAFLELSGRGTLYTTKHVLFWLGFALLAYASFQLRPPSPRGSDQPYSDLLTAGDDRQRKADTTVGGRRETRLERLVSWLPPVRWVALPPDDRFSVNAKLLLASVFMLLLSMAMEFVFGIAQPGAA
ncbi:DUF7555 family protein [Haloarchaeobius amylolyticus]|uniref:DUF7555 family protein n=1 Tax=Haloarchaeobius amylolyticus TaxID=1198296 RepID=UPI0022700587|nr:hypothetical protein [Haloarchaeobius amylolyticus]